MKKIVVKNLFDFESEVLDCYTIVEAFREAGYEICLEQAYMMWENYSQSERGINWFCLPKDLSVIVAKLQSYFDEDTSE